MRYSTFAFLAFFPTLDKAEVLVLYQPGAREVKAEKRVQSELAGRKTGLQTCLARQPSCRVGLHGNYSCTHLDPIEIIRPVLHHAFALW